MKAWTLAGVGLFAVAAFAEPTIPVAPQTAAPLVTTVLGEATQTIIGQPNIVPTNSTVRLSRLVFAPGAKTAEHKHLYPHYALIEEGTLSVVNTQTGQSSELKAGTFFLEMIDTWHYGINKTAAPVKLLLVDLTPADVKSNSIAKPTAP